MDDDRKPEDSGLKSEEEEQNQEQDQEQYSFIKETVKDRPLRVRRVLQPRYTNRIEMAFHRSIPVRQVIESGRSYGRRSGPARQSPARQPV